MSDARRTKTSRRSSRKRSARGSKKSDRRIHSGSGTLAARSVAHRSGLVAAGTSLRPSPELFRLIGGRAVVGRLIEAFYDRLHADPRLRPKFTNSPFERANQKMFFEEWLGGEPLYSQHIAISGIGIRHSHIFISPSDASAWLRHFTAALAECGVDEKVRRRILRALKPLARAMVNESEDVTSLDEHRCKRSKSAEAARKAAHKGDLDEVRTVAGDAELFAHASPLMLHAAAARGRMEIVEELLKAGADPNVAVFCGWSSANRTPLCAAMENDRADAENVLRAWGAVDDIFTAATLGDLAAVKDWIAQDAGLLNVVDPAQDFFRVTPLYHATFAGHRPIVEFLLHAGASVGDLSTHLTRSAADQADPELLVLLLEHGADATRVGTGRWVLEPKIAPLLFRAGADVNYEAHPWQSWMWQSCTGNHGQRDDPEFVRALLVNGIDDVNRIHPHWQRAALHFAAKAGFSESVRVLLEHGADPNLPDEKAGETPLFYAFKAGKSVDPRVVAEVLLGAGADPSIRNRKGRTVAEANRRARDVLGG